MPTAIESLTAQVNVLDTNTTALLAAVSDVKTDIIARVAEVFATNASAGDAARSAAAALISAAFASTDRGLASASAEQALNNASQALAIYGTTNAMNAALITAAAQTQLAQTAAVSASSVLQQDLSAISTALHRSPNPVTALFIYDTSRDSDGGAWVERMQHTSWMNEPLCGAWLTGGFASELLARGDNLLPYAEQIDNAAWIKGVGVSVIGNVRDPIGGLSAQKIDWSSAAVNAGFSNSNGSVVVPTGQPNIRSVWLRSDTPGTLIIGNPYYAAANLTANITTIWQKFELIQTPTATSDSIAVRKDAGSPATIEIYAPKLNRVGALPSTYSASPELVSNGGFDSGTVGWTATNGATLASTVSEITVTAGTAANGSASQAITTVIGQAYSINVTARKGTATDARLWVGTTAGAFNIGSVAAPTTTNTALQFVFVATGTTTYISLTSFGAVIGNTAFFSAVSCKQITTLATPYVPYSTQAGSYYQSSADGKFYKLGATYGTLVEVFRGNKAKFPRLSAIVAEAGSITIYDLTEKGCPMWMRFKTIGTSVQAAIFSGTIGSVAAINGLMCVGASNVSFGLFVQINFAKDTTVSNNGSTTGYNIQVVSLRNSTAGMIATLNYFPAAIASRDVNAVAMTVLPDAPIDIATGLQVPTIAVGTQGGTSIIRHDGTIISSAINPTSVAYTVFSPSGLWVSRNASIGSAYFYSNASISAGVIASPTGFLGGIPIRDGWVFRLAASKSVIGLGSSSPALPELTFVRTGIQSVAARLQATIADRYNTGYMTGDIRRCYLANTIVESISATELVTNGTFDVDTAGWTLINTGSATATVSAGVVTLNPVDIAGIARIRQQVNVTVGKAYNITFVGLSESGSPATVTVGTAAGGAEYFTVPSVSNTSTYSKVIVATSAQLWISYFKAGTVLGIYQVDSVSVKEVIADRSYKAAGANIFGTLVKSAVGVGSQLVAYSGFSPANYARETYSADLDVGTNDLSVSVWVNTTGYGPSSLMLFPEQFDNAVWIKSNITVTANATVAPDGSTTADKLSEGTSAAIVNRVFQLPMFVAGLYTFSVYAKPAGRQFFAINSFQSGGTGFSAIFDLSSGTAVSGGGTITADLNGFYRCSVSVISLAAVREFEIRILLNAITPLYTGDGVSGIYVWGAMCSPGLLQPYRPGLTTAYNGTVALVDRSAATGPSFMLGMDGNAKLVATLYDGTTTRTVTTTAAYNTGTPTKARLNYSAGRLAISVNGLEVASTVGAPLLTLNNAAATLTIGNSRTLDAPFPGSIALLKVGATLPTPEQAVFMYEQEKQMFRDGAQITLPAATAVADLAYDEQLDKWVAIQAGNESSFTGLIRTATGTPSSGNFSNVRAQSGVKLLSRITANPGVDVTVPAYGLRDELVRRAEAAAKASKTLTVFDFDAVGFTATTTNLSNQLTVVASIIGTPYIGMGITGVGIPVNTIITNINGAIYTMSANATATANLVAIGQSTFQTPAGWTATEVLSAGASKREGPTKDFVRNFDGFRETIRFAVAPGSAAWVQITAKKE
jgi:hypothetical protein